MPVDPNFPHLPLPLVKRGAFRAQGFGEADARTDLNKEDRAGHSQRLLGQARAVSDYFKRARGERGAEAPDIPGGIPLLLEIDPEAFEDLDWLITTFGLEIVSEEVDGYVIVASEDVELSVLEAKINDFATAGYGSGNTARIYSISDDDARVRRVLSEALYQQWPLADHREFVVEISIECLGTTRVPPYPERRMAETDEQVRERFNRYLAQRNPREQFEKYVKRNPKKTEQTLASYERSKAAWTRKRDEAEAEWENLKEARENLIVSFVEGYGGEVLDLYEAAERKLFRFPDSLGARIRILGVGLKDLVQNIPYVFEVTEPDEFELLPAGAAHQQPAPDGLVLFPPDLEAPRVCVIDSGIQEEHVLLEPAIERECSLSLVADGSVSDFVRPGGHGTRVAGAVLYGEAIPESGEHALTLWVQNARVLDGDCKVPHAMYPPDALAEIVRVFQEATGTRIYNHSINASRPCRLKYMSAWAAAIDLMSHERDLLFVQSAGNIPRWLDGIGAMGIINHLQAGRDYPQYLTEDSCRIANPAQSLHALTVGSVSYGAGGCFGGPGEPSSFSRTGLGPWNTIKPEVVEYGGDWLRDGPTGVIDGPAACPELVRSTMYPPGPWKDRDAGGTSFAAPKVAHIAALLQSLLPDEPALLYRALIAQSARWPDWTNGKDPSRVLRQIGYGIPEEDRALSNTQYRITLVTHGIIRIEARTAHVYSVPIPDELRDAAATHQIRIDVTLSYTARPRRTRRKLRGYLSTRLTWMSSNREESLNSFANRALSDAAAPQDGAGGFAWYLDERANVGTIRNTNRHNSTLQKDWVIVPSHQLPESFCIAVVGRPGWSNDPADSARYAIAVSFEALNEDVRLYEMIRAEVDAIQARVEVNA